MKSYFIRHDMDITKEATTELFDEKLIAVHFQNTPEESDNVDYLDINNYKASSAQRAIKIFKELNENGGYIWAEYFEEIRIGKVRPYSFDKSWKPSKENPKQKSLLKTLKMYSTKNIEPKDAMSLKVARPPFTTVTEWKAVGKRLECLVNGRSLPKKWESLYDSEQESVCAEFLREKHKKLSNFPILKYLLLPVGRTMKDVDIYGITHYNKLMFAQVTFKREKDSTNKINNLKKYDGEKVFFCERAFEELEFKEKECMWFVPLKFVEKWLLSNTQLADQLFSLRNRREKQ